MADAVQKETIIAGNFKVEYKKRSLLRILKWWKEIKADRFGKDLYIVDEDVERVFVNGKQYGEIIS